MHMQIIVLQQTLPKKQSCWEQRFILPFKQEQRDDVSLMSLSEKHALENKINEPQEALVCEKKKNMTLEHYFNTSANQLLQPECVPLFVKSDDDSYIDREQRPDCIL